MLAFLATAAVFFTAPFLLDVPLAAQSSPAPVQAPAPASATPGPVNPPAHHHKKPSAAKPSAQPAPAPASVAQSAPVPVPCPDASLSRVLPLTPVVPPTPVLSPAVPCIPNWPANKKPVEASVVWDSHGLYIQASNSSLDQILNDIALKTGAKVEGMGADERVFGTYGPGPARDVVTELLDGTGYNVLLVGDLGQGTPRRIVLSGRPTGAAQPSGQNNPAQNEGDQDDQVTATEPPPPSQPEPPPVPARSPEPMMQRRPEQMQPMPPQQNNPQNPQ
jgi:hypothetical protein